MKDLVLGQLKGLFLECFGVEKIEDLADFSNGDDFLNLYNDLRSNSRGEVVAGFEAAVIDAVINNVDSNSIRFVLDNFIKKLEVDIMYMDSLFLRKEYYEFLFNDEQKEKIESIRENYKQHAIESSNKFLKSEEDENTILKCYGLNIDLNDINQKVYIRRILRENKVLSNPLEYTFFVRYISMWAQRKMGIDINVPVFIDTYNFSSYAAGCCLDYIVLVSENTTFKPSELVNIICHEMEHVIQNVSFATKENSVRALDVCIVNMFEKIDPDRVNGYYMQNYGVQPIEEDAIRESKKYTGIFLDEYGFPELKSEEDFEEQIFSHCVGTFKIKDFFLKPVNSFDGLGENTGEASDIKEPSYSDLVDKALKVYIKDNPTFIEDNPVLKNLYHEDGEVKSFEEMMESDFSLGDNKLIFYNHIVRYINEGALDELPSSNKMASNLYLILSQLLNVLNDMNIVINHVDAQTRRLYLISVAKKILNYFSNNLDEVPYYVRDNYTYVVEKLISYINSFESNSNKVEELAGFYASSKDELEGLLLNVNRGHKTR